MFEISMECKVVPKTVFIVETRLSVIQSLILKYGASRVPSLIEFKTICQKSYLALLRIVSVTLTYSFLPAAHSASFHFGAWSFHVIPKQSCKQNKTEKLP